MTTVLPGRLLLTRNAVSATCAQTIPFSSQQSPGFGTCGKIRREKAAPNDSTSLQGSDLSSAILFPQSFVVPCRPMAHWGSTRSIPMLEASLSTELVEHDS